MSVVYFSMDEACILAMYRSETVLEAVGKIKSAMYNVEDPNMLELMENVLVKLDSMSDEEYSQLDLAAYNDQISGEEYEDFEDELENYEGNAN